MIVYVILGVLILLSPLKLWNIRIGRPSFLHPIASARNIIETSSQALSPNFSLKSEIPDYFGYSEILSKLLKFRKAMGANINDSLVLLRRGVYENVRFNKTIESSLFGALFEFVVLMVVSWGFFLTLCSQMEINLDVNTILTVLSLHLFAPLIFITFYIKLKKRSFNDFTKIQYSIFALLSVSEMAIPLSKISELARIKDLLEVDNDKLKEVSVAITNAFKGFEKGGDIIDELNNQLNELEYLKGELQEKFTKYLELVKFLLMGGFYLGSYFILIANVFSQIL